MENKAHQKPNFSLSQLFHHRVTDEFFPIFNINGTIRKCQKSQLVQKMNLVELPIKCNYIALIDMGYLWRISTPSAEDSEKNEESEFTWFDWVEKLFALILARHKKATTIVCVNDPYDDNIINIKDSERIKRSGGEALFAGSSKDIYHQRDEFPSSTEFQQMFRNKRNKRRIQIFLKNQFASVSQNKNVKFIYSVRTCCEDLSVSPHTRITEFECEHSEADTILLVIYSQIRKLNTDDIVVVDAEDTNVVVLCAHVAHQIDGVLGLKRKGSIILHNK